MCVRDRDNMRYWEREIIWENKREKEREEVARERKRGCLWERDNKEIERERVRKFDFEFLISVKTCSLLT